MQAAQATTKAVGRLPVLGQEMVEFRISLQALEIVIVRDSLDCGGAFVKSIAQMRDGAISQSGAGAAQRFKVTFRAVFHLGCRLVNRRPGGRIEDVLVEGKRLSIGVGASTILVLHQQIGAKILDNLRGLRFDPQSLLVIALGRTEIMKRILDCREIVESTKIVGFEYQRLLVAAGSIVHVEEHLVGDAILFQTAADGWVTWA